MYRQTAKHYCTVEKAVRIYGIEYRCRTALQSGFLDQTLDLKMAEGTENPALRPQVHAVQTKGLLALDCTYIFISPSWMSSRHTGQFSSCREKMNRGHVHRAGLAFNQAWYM